MDLAVFFSDSQISSRGLDPKYIDPVPVTQKVIEGGGMGFFRRNGEVGVLVSFDDAKILHDFLPHAANKNQHGDRIFFGEGREREIEQVLFQKYVFF